MCVCFLFTTDRRRYRRASIRELRHRYCFLACKIIQERIQETLHVCARVEFAQMKTSRRSRTSTSPGKSSLFATAWWALSLTLYVCGVHVRVLLSEQRVQIFRGNKVWNAQKRGAAAVVIYSDPADYGPPHHRSSIQFTCLFATHCAQGICRVLRTRTVPGPPTLPPLVGQFSTTSFLRIFFSH
jgi:hypothetical protein